MPEQIDPYIVRLKDRFGDAWDQLDQEQKVRLRERARQANEGDIGFHDFWLRIKSLDWVDAILNPAPAPTPDPTPTPTPEPEPEDTPIDGDVRDLLMNFLTANQLPTSLMGFITDSLAQHKSYAQIVAELRLTPEYKAAYPENDLRLANGLAWMPEEQIRATRDEIRRLSNEYLGIGNVSQEEINNVIGSGWSLQTFETKLQRLREMDRWGPTVRMVLESELGHSISDDRLFAFFDDTPTPELDTAYEKALLRGQPALLGLGVRPEDEAEILRRYGIAPEQAFRGYQELAKELPQAQRLSLIEAEIGRNTQSFPSTTQLFADTPFATLFRAIQLQDPAAIAKLQGQMAREVARFQGQGGVAQSQTGASVGLLEEEDRQL